MTKAAGQIVFTLAAVASVASVGSNRPWNGWTGGGVVATAAGLAGLLGIQRAGGCAWSRVWPNGCWPGLPPGGLRGLHADLMRLQAPPSVMALGVA